MPTANGTFEVLLTPQTQDVSPDTPKLGRLLLDKEFKGDLEGRSKGQMLSAGTNIENSASYVAIEYVTAKLHGRRGTFALMHNATMTRGKGVLNIIVVPDSGTDELTGLSGQMSIDISDGKHAYTFEYTLA